MNGTDTGRLWSVRAARAGAAALAALAVIVWTTPVNVRTPTGVFGCGSPADPHGGGQLGELVCATDLDKAMWMALALLVAAGSVLFLSEFVAPRWGPRPWVSGVIAVSPVGLALVALGTAGLLTVVGGATEAGSPFRCGTALRPAVDPVSAMVCGQLAEARLTTSLGGVALGLGLLAAGAYLAGGRFTPGSASVADSGAHGHDGVLDGGVGSPRRSQGEP